VPVGDLERCWDGLAARAVALRQVERAVADDLAEGAAAWRAGKARRLRSWLLVAGAVLVATLAAAAAVRRVRDGGREPVLIAGGTVLGLARRGQALADRQLQLLKGLTRDEPDPQRRRGLLGADNLAGRLRRTVQTMLAVAGARTLPAPAHRGGAPRRRRRGRARRGTHPAGRGGPGRPELTPAPGPGRRLELLADGDAGAAPAAPGPTPAPGAGRRVDLLSTGDVEVAGPAAVDLVHLLAELLDNAAAFSPPRRRSWSPGRPTATGTWSRSPTAASA